MSRVLVPLPTIWKLKRLLCIGSEKRLKEAIRTIDQFAFEIIRSKEEESTVPSVNSEEKLDLLSRFMRSNVELEFKTPEERRKFYRDIIVSFILAGKDSTLVAFTWFFWFISGHRHCERQIYEEISAATAARSSGERNLNYDDLKSFNYLHAALSESLRLFPPVPGNSRLAVNDDTLPDGTRIRGGWVVDYSIYAMGRMEKVWGSDCLEFRPQRWLDGERNFQVCEQFKYPVFHGGPRICLGKDMAYVQMKVVVVSCALSL
nr:cytochrome P450 [Fagopyrum tataricum]